MMPDGYGLLKKFWIPNRNFIHCLVMILNEKDWVKIAESIDEISFGSNGIAELDVAGKRICVAKYCDGLVAFAHKCPHAGGRFADGFIDVLGNVVCPLHRYKFCLKNGRNISGEGYYLNRWPVAFHETGIYVRLESRM